MTLCRGIDFHSTNSYLAVIDETLHPQLQRRSRTDLLSILELLEPYREDLAGLAVESTFNWYWLVDVLQDAGYLCHLINTWAAKQYPELKYTDESTRRPL